MKEGLIMKKTLVFLSLFFASFLTNTTYAVIHSYSLWEKKDQRIVVLGDSDSLNTGELQILDEEHTRTLIDTLKNTTTSFNIILEASPVGTVKLFGRLQKKQPLSALELIIVYTMYQNGNLANISVTQADIRGTLFSDMVNFYSKICEEQNIDQLKEYAPQTSWKEFLDKMDTIVNKIKEFSESKKDSTDRAVLAMLKHLNDLAKKLKRQISHVKKYFDVRKVMDQPYVQSFINKIQESNDISLHRKIYEDTFAPLIGLTGDLGFIKSLIEAMNGHDKILCFVRNNHAIELNNFLQKSGFQQSVYVEAQTQATDVSTISKEQFEEFITGALSSHSGGKKRSKHKNKRRK